MKKILGLLLITSSLMAFSQSLPKAFLLEVSNGESLVVAVLDKQWKALDDDLPANQKQQLQRATVKLLTDVGQIGTAKMQGSLEVGNCGVISKPIAKVSRQIYGLVAPWKIAPRKIERLPLDNAVYQKVMAAELVARGIKAPVQMTQVLKADLDGDQSDEVILVAQRPALSANYELVGMGYAMKAHDYALAIVRKLTSSGVKTFVLRQAWAKADFDVNSTTNLPPRFAQWVNGVADFDGDGKMEVLVNSILYEGYGFEVFGWNNKKFEMRFEWGCI